MVLGARGLKVAAIDLWYVHESSAAAVLAWQAEIGADVSAINPEGGALACAAPIGAVGAGLFAAAAESVARGRAQLAGVCVAGEGGTGTACILAAV
jgi:acetyl-CoA acetyltransferase